MIQTKKSARLSIPVKLLVAAILILLVILPIARMFSAMTLSDFKKVCVSPLFHQAAVNSVVLSAIATLISVVLAYVLALCMVRTNMLFKRIFSVVLILPMLIPSLSHGMGLIMLFGQNGFFTNLFHWNGSIYGAKGIVLGSVLYAFPVAYIMLSDVLKYEDLSVYEAANVLGISRSRQFLRLTLPYLKKPLIAALFSTFSLIVTDYGVPLMVGGKVQTISTLMYEEAIGRLNYGSGSVYGAFLLIPAIIAFVTDALNKERASTAFVKKESQDHKHSIREILALTVCILVSLFALLPIFAFVVLAFTKSYPSDMTFTLSNITKTFAQNGGSFLKNSLLIAFLTATVGTVLSYITAYLTARMHSALSQLIHLLVLTFMAIPGLVLGLSYVITFRNMFFSGTLAIIIMVNTAHFMSSPYLMMHNTFGKMNENFEAVGATLGVGRLRMLRDVFIPQSVSTIAEMFSYLFVNCMMTISAVSFLFTSDTKPISLMINEFAEFRNYECVAVVSLLILVTNILMKVIIGLVKHATSHKTKIRKDSIS